MLYPQLNEKRTKISLNGVWKFKLDENGIGDKEKWYANEFKDFKYMSVPGSFAEILIEKGIRNYCGDVWYQTDLIIPNNILEYRKILRFGSVTQNCTVYINGEKVGEHIGGYTPFEIDISHLTGKNLLTIKINTILTDETLPVGYYVEEKIGDKTFKKNIPNFDFFNYCGIHRDVLVYTTNKDYIEDITVKTLNINDNNALLRYNIKTKGHGEINVEVYDEEGILVATSKSQENEILIKNVNLWNPLKPYLYKIKVKFSNDLYELDYGIRTVEVKNKKFYINNKEFYFKGFGKHEDAYYLGKSQNDALNILDLNLMKWINANSFRTSHYPYSEEMMMLCDKLGIVVIDEVPAVGVHLNFTMNVEKTNRNTWKEIKTYENHKKVIEELINRDKNYACVVMWSIANEADTATEGAYEYFKPLYDLTKQLDDTRPATIVLIGESTPDKCKVSSMIDVICLNRYYGWYTETSDLEMAKLKLKEELDGFVLKYPEKPILITEYGADTIAGFHTVFDEVLYTEEFQNNYYKAYHEIMDKCENLIGEQVWNFADFETIENLKRIQGNKKGIFTRDRKPKMIAHYFKERWLNK